MINCIKKGKGKRCLIGLRKFLISNSNHKREILFVITFMLKFIISLFPSSYGMCSSIFFNHRDFL